MSQNKRIIIAVLNEKGGTGKSTLSINLATGFKRAGYNTVIVDTDPQGTSGTWAKVAFEPGDENPELLNELAAQYPTVVAIDKPEILDVSLKSINADIIILDTPAKAEKMTRTAIRVAHVGLVVLQPSGPDVWATDKIVELINSKKDLGGEIDAYFLLNRINTSTNLSKQAMAGEWNTYGYEKLESTISNRVSFATSLTEGKTIYQTNDATGKAEMDFLVEELKGRLWQA